MTHEPENMVDQDWEVEQAEVERPVSVVVSVRLPAEIGHRLTAEAASRDLGVSALVREAVIHYLDTIETVRTSFDWTVSSSGVSVAFYAGRGVHGRTAGTALTLEDALAERC